jgi:hypothetical protein
VRICVVMVEARLGSVLMAMQKRKIVVKIMKIVMLMMVMMWYGIFEMNFSIGLKILKFLFFM